MTAIEARLIVDEINTGIVSIGDKLLELYDREGWKALGYSSWRDCVTVEFNFGQSRVYQLLSFAQVTRNIDSTIGGKVILPTSERQTRPLTDLPPAQQAETWREAQNRNGTVQPSGQQVEVVAREFKSITKESQTKMNPKPKVPTGGFSQVSRYDDMSQVGPDDDFSQDNGNGEKRVKGFTKEQLIEMLGEFDDFKTCPYCGHKI